MFKGIVRSGIQGAGHGLYFSKRYKLAARVLQSSLRGADDWEVPLIKASLGACLFHLGKYEESKKCLEFVIKDAKSNPESWEDDYSLEVLEQTSTYLDKLENLTKQ
jgi:tetratricopeptide (TPR) repeat protein